MTQETVRPFDAGNWFPVHNAIFDVIMPSLSPNGWKVLCVAIRQTWGWRDPDSNDPRVRKKWDHIPYSQFLEKTGIGSRATLSRALDECIDRGYLIRRQPLDEDGEPRTVRGQPYYEYALNQDYELTDSETEPVGDATGSETVPVTGSETEPEERSMGSETVPPKQNNKQTTNTADVVALSDRQQQAFDNLLERGFQPEIDARRFAVEKTDAAIGWSEYARRENLGGGFIRARLIESADPPEEKNGTTSYPPESAKVWR
jgi:hypothetical protein